MFNDIIGMFIVLSDKYISSTYIIHNLNVNSRGDMNLKLKMITYIKYLLNEQNPRIKPSNLLNDPMI